MRQYGSPVIVDQSTGEALSLAPLRLSGSAASRGYDEAFIQKLVLNSPTLLPLDQIDPTCVEPAPICDELPTAAGPIDVFMITQTGMPVLVECKLWNNPQARREVVGQIIDYAKELQQWSYEDLQRACAERCGSDFDLFERVSSLYEGMDERVFVDSVTRNLRDGRCVLLVVGDGIREGVEAIGEYLTGSGALQFSFGLIELPVFDAGNGRLLVTPRTLAKTSILGRYVVSLGEGASPAIVDLAAPDAENADLAADAAKQALADENLRFWTEVLQGLEFDDPAQELPRPKPYEYTYCWLPAPRNGGVVKDNWITFYLARSSNEAGLFFTGTRTGFGGEIARAMLEDRDSILEELGPNARITQPKPGKVDIGEAMPLGDLKDPANRKAVTLWLRERANHYINVFRPRVEEVATRLS